MVAVADLALPSLVATILDRPCSCTSVADTLPCMQQHLVAQQQAIVSPMRLPAAAQDRLAAAAELLGPAFPLVAVLDCWFAVVFALSVAKVPVRMSVVEFAGSVLEQVPSAVAGTMQIVVH